MPNAGRGWRLLRFAVFAVLFALLLGGVLIGYAYWEAVSDPVVRRAGVSVTDWPAGEPARTVLLVSDVHVAGPDMPPERAARIATQLSALRPDLVVLAGDFISDKSAHTRSYTPDEIARALAHFRAPLGVVAVLGNHDHPQAAKFRRAFAAVGITVLRNGAVVRGPFLVGGVADLWTDHADVAATERALDALGPGPRLVFTHNPDIVPRLNGPTTAVLAGHTHCGQIVLPLIGPIATMSRYGRRFACGAIEDKGRRLFVTAGLGTSILPLRLGAPPDAWLIRFGPDAGSSGRR